MGWTVLVAVASVGVGSAQGNVFLTKAQALELAFPKCDVTRDTVFLDAAQVARVAKLAHCPFRNTVLQRYVAKRKGALVGTAYFDVHRVRTLRETLMVVVDPTNRVSRVEVLAFGEPREYVPKVKWYAQFKSRKLDQELQLKRAIRGMSGATLTARATTRCARRMLAVHQVVAEIAAAKELAKHAELAKRAALAKATEQAESRPLPTEPENAPRPRPTESPSVQPAPTKPPAPAPRTEKPKSDRRER